MNHSATAPEQVRLLLQAPRFKNLCRRATEISEQRKFNVFRFAADTISENAWSRVFAWLLDSTEDHEFGNVPFQSWLQIALADELGIRDSRDIGTVLTTTEFRTEEGRRVDILIKALDGKGRVLAVIGIENKVWSVEQHLQIADYQLDLANRFPDPIRKLIVFLTPDARQPITADDNAICPSVAKGYDTILDVCDTLIRTRNSNRNLVNLLKQMKSYLEKEVTGTREIKQLVRQLYSQKKYRDGLRLISQNLPSTIDVFSELKERVKNALSKPQSNVKHRWYPARGSKPYDMRLIPSRLEAVTYRGQTPFAVNYILTCDEDNPDVGDVFKLIVAAWCKNKGAALKAKDLMLPHEPKTWRESTHRVWVTLWTGNDYRLKDLGSSDAQALSILLTNAIQETYAGFVKKAGRF